MNRSPEPAGLHARQSRPSNRGLVVWAISLTVVLAVFFGFCILGWPGSPDSCVADDSCFCEDFDRAIVDTPAGGVRQPINTWFNLYALLTSLIVALVLRHDRRAGAASNRIASAKGGIADLYVFAVLFLGLGSMWFHASLKEWAGNIDGLSMYVFLAFLASYTAHRLRPSPTLFWIGYLALVAAATVVHWLWQWDFAPLVIVTALVVVYLVLEIATWCKEKTILLGRTRPRALWLGAVLAIIVATIFWWQSRTGGPWCNPNACFQAHGMLWHPLAGVTAVLLFLYWRQDHRRATEPVNLST